MNSNDIYITGDFNGDRKCDLLCISIANRILNLQTYNTSSNAFYSIWTKTSTLDLGPWYVQSTDRFYVGDFTGNGKDDIFCVSDAGWAMLLSFTGSNWTAVWSNNGNGEILSLNARNRITEFTVGKFTQSSRAEILGINKGNNWSTVLRYNTSSKEWDWIWSQYGGNNFGSWDLPLRKDSTEIVAGKFNPSNSKDLILFAQEGKGTTNKLAKVIGHNANDFSSQWTNGKNSKLSSDYSIGGNTRFKKTWFTLKNGGRTYLMIVELYLDPLPLGDTGHFHIFRFNAATMMSLVKGLQDESPILMHPNEILFDENLKIEDLNEVSIYPNPATTTVTVETELEAPSIQVYNSLGSIILSTTDKTIDLSSYPSGTYIFNVNGKVKKVLKK